MRRTARQQTVLSDSVGYLIRDEFVTDRAAGAVHTTSAEPGPGTRTVVDANSKLTISSGLLSFATGGAAGGNPGLWYERPSSREPGRFCVASYTHTNQGVAVGFDSNTTGSLTEAFRLNGTTLGVVANSTNVTVGTVTTSTPYQLCVTQRFNGAMFLIKGGAFTDWQLQFIGNLGQDVLGPGLSAISTASVATFDYFRVPHLLWMPSPLVSDGFFSDFGISDGLGQEEEEGATGAGLAGTVWTQATGTWATDGDGAVAAATLSGGLAIATVTASTADVLVGADLTRSAGNVGGVLRYTDTSNYLRFYHDGTNAVLQQVLAGNATSPISAVATYSAGAKMFARCVGTAARLYYNNALVGSGTVDAALTGTKAGLYTTDTGNTITNFVVYAAGTSGEYSFLNGF
jgi:hypothetical protein